MPAERSVSPDTIAVLRAAGCLYAEDEARILTQAAGSADELRSLLERRAAGEPLEYVVGWAEFCGLRVPVRRGVFVPRRRSELLVECAVQAVSEAAHAARGSRRVSVLDLCCGSGAIGLAIATRAGAVELSAADDSPAAAACARENLADVGGQVYLGDLFDALPASLRGRLDVIVANAPYVPTGEIPRLPAEARLYEPHSTLDGGQDGTRVQARILAAAEDWLSATGVVLIETERAMSERTVRIARDAGFATHVRESDELDATVVIATRRA